jgi:hypothetical protein
LSRFSSQSISFWVTFSIIYLTEKAASGYAPL